jgi:hypothetical protein
MNELQLQYIAGYREIVWSYTQHKFIIYFQFQVLFDFSFI